jgi:hypothetical protein
MWLLSNCQILNNILNAMLEEIGVVSAYTIARVKCKPLSWNYILNTFEIQILLFLDVTWGHIRSHVLKQPISAKPYTCLWPLGHVGHVTYSIINMMFISTGIFDDKLRPQILAVDTTTNSPLRHTVPLDTYINRVNSFVFQLGYWYILYFLLYRYIYKSTIFNYKLQNWS